MPKLNEEITETTTPAPAPAPRRKASSTFDPKTMKIMSPEDKEKAEAKAAIKEEKRRKIEEREAAQAEKRRIREQKMEEKLAKASARLERKKMTQEEKDANIKRKNEIADLLLKVCQEEKIKCPSFRKHVKGQGESFDINEDGDLVILDARGQNPVPFFSYIVEVLDEETLSAMKKTEPKRQSGWPKKESKKRVRPEEHGIVRLESRESIVPIEDEMPWSNFSRPTGVLMNIQDAVVAPQLIDGKMVGLRLTAQGEDYGLLNREASRSLGRMIGYKVDFIDKISGNPELALGVVNHMIQDYRPQVMMFAGDNLEIRDVCPGWRDVASHAEICQSVYNTMKSRYQDVHIEKCEISKNGDLEFIVTVDTPNGQVTPQEGDYLQGGVRVTHRYGTEVKVGLFVKRLVCTNGLTASTTSYGWTSRGAGSIQSQIAYIEMQTIESLGRFESLVENARKMSTTIVEGDINQVIKERLKQMGVPMNNLSGIIEAYTQEPGNTEWHILNAITRFATHTMGLGRNMREVLMEGSGDWVHQFDVVKARIPRNIANRIGAQIIEGD